MPGCNEEGIRLVNQRTLRPRLRKLITLITYDHSLKTTLVSVTFMLFKDEQGFNGNDLNALIVLIFGSLYINPRLEAQQA